MAGSERRCHYEVLGLRLDCSADEIRPAYKKLALQLHPDKLIQSGLSQAEATAKFQELSHAYEVLSDPKERAWYDSHRSKILFADPSTSDSSVPDLFSYFSNSAFSGYSSDSKKSFFKVYSEVFNRVYANEVDFARRMGLGANAVREAPAMGDLDSPYAQASAFYAHWTGFSTVMDFCWADPYDAAAGLNRKSRRVMEDENAKARRKARREYNETVRGLAEFARKRDKRVIDMAVRRREEEEKRKEEQRERKRREERERMERARAYQEPEWARTVDDDEEVEDDASEEEETAKEAEAEGELYCVACGKKFKSEKQWKNHEQSKKHKEKVAQIRREIADDDYNDDDDNDDNNDNEDPQVEELGEMMRDTVQVGPSDADDDEFVETAEKDNVVVIEEEKADEEDKDSVKTDNVVAEEDEIGVLEAMLGGRKNRKKASAMRKVEENDDDNNDGDMEYNNRKSTRKSRRAKKGKNGNPEAAKPESNGNDTKEELGGDDNDSTDQHVDKKGMASKSKTSSKGKKTKASSKNTGHECEKCGEDFESKNRLHKHLMETGHASLKYR